MIWPAVHPDATVTVAGATGWARRHPRRWANQAARVLMGLLGGALLLACGGGDGGSGDDTTATALEPTVLNWTYPADTASADWPWALPAHMPAPRVPADNPMNAAKVALGRLLFYDPRLSGDGSLSCASCHVQSRAFSDALARPTGITGQVHPRNSMALVNVAYNATQTWANPALATLERQITNPVFGTEPVEMGVDESSAHAVLQRLANATDVDYVAHFQQAFTDSTNNTGDLLTWEYVLKAISAFERTMISADSRYDRHVQQRAQLTPQELNGLQLFTTARCVQCHAPPHFGGQFVSVQTSALAVRYHNVGLYNLNGQGAYPKDNQGALDITGNLADMGAFRAPTLRNIEVTGPYMHDGSVATLQEAVAIMAGGGRNVTNGPNAGDGRTNPYKSPLLVDQGLSTQEQADLVAFLKTLTDEEFLGNPALSNPFAAPQGHAITSFPLD